MRERLFKLLSKVTGTYEPEPDEIEHRESILFDALDLLNQEARDLEAAKQITEEELDHWRACIAAVLALREILAEK